MRTYEHDHLCKNEDCEADLELMVSPAMDEYDHDTWEPSECPFCNTEILEISVTGAELIRDHEEAKADFMLDELKDRQMEL